MQAKELMLNDLVLFDNRVCKIVATNAYRDCVELIDINDEDNEVVGKYAKHISPIPLTPEILELNGWKESSIMLEHIAIDIMQRKDRRRWYVEVSKLEDTDAYSVITLLTLHSIRFVHELQRALRCCGLWDLANNFKIK